MYEIKTPEESRREAARIKALHSRMHQVRLHMSGCAHMLPYLVNGDLLGDAHKEAETYLALLSEWNALYAECYGVRVEEADECGSTST